MDKPLSSCLSYWIVVTFLPEKQRLSLAKNVTHHAFVSLHYSVIVVTVLKKKSQRLSLHWTFPHKTASPLSSERVRQRPLFTDVDWI